MQTRHLAALAISFLLTTAFALAQDNYEIQVYPSELVPPRTTMRSRTVKDRPFLELEETDHPLAVEQRSGISVERLREIASQAIHKRRY